MTYPVKLQINSTGAWRDVLRFDMNAADICAVMDAAALLVILADPLCKTGLRISTADTHQKAISRWDAQKGWVDA
jgi:hypothetical protein